MEPIDTNTQYAVETYLADLKPRENAGWCLWFRKRLILIGSGEDQRLECHYGGLLLIQRLWAMLFENGSSIDFTDISLYLSRKNFKNKQFSTVVARYYGWSQRFDPLEDDQQNKIINLVSPTALSPTELSCLHEWSKLPQPWYVSGVTRFGWIQSLLGAIESLSQDEKTEVMKAARLLETKGRGVEEIISCLYSLKRFSPEELQKLLTVLDITEMRSYKISRELSRFQSLPQETRDNILTLLNRSGIKTDDLGDIMALGSRCAKTLKVMVKCPHLFVYNTPESLEKEIDSFDRQIRQRISSEEFDFVVTTLEECDASGLTRNDLIEFVNEARHSYINFYLLRYPIVFGIKKTTVKETFSSLLATQGKLPTKLFKTLTKLVKEGKADILALAETLPITEMNEDAKRDLLKVLTHIPREERASIVEHTKRLVTKVYKNEYLGDMVQAIRQVPSEERDSVITNACLFGISEQNIAGQVEILSVIQAIPQGDREHVISSAKSFASKRLLMSNDIKNLFRAISAIPREEREEAFTYCKELARKLSHNITLDIAILDALAVIPREKMESVAENALRFRIFCSYNIFVNPILYVYLLPPELRNPEEHLVRVTRGEHQTAVQVSLEQILASGETSPHALRRLAYFIFDDLRALGLYVEEHPLVQRSIEIIAAEAVPGEKNAFSLYRKLQLLSKTPLDFVAPVHTVAGIQIAFSTSQLQVSVKAFTVDRSQVPEEATAEAWQQLVFRLKQKIESNAQANSALTTLFGITWQVLWDDVFSSPYFSGLLAISKNPVNFVEAQLRMIIHYLLSKDCQARPGSVFTEQEEVLIKTAMSIRACPAGKREGICLTYQLLEPRYHYPAKGLDTGSPQEVAAKEFLAQVVQKCIADQFSGGNAFMKELIGIDDIQKIKQMAHQTIYIKNLIGHLVGLSHELAFDWHTGVLYDSLLVKTREEALQAFFRHLTPAVVVKELVRVVNSDPHHNIGIVRELVKNSAQMIEEGWDMDDEDLSMKLNDRGAVYLLHAAGYFKYSLGTVT